MKEIVKSRLAEVTDQLFENLSRIRYGQVSVTLKIHDGRVADITHTVTESTRGNYEQKNTP
jgi:hypothetical protein